MRVQVDQAVRRFYSATGSLITPRDRPLPKWVQSKTRRHDEDSRHGLTCLSAILIVLAQISRMKIETRFYLGDGDLGVADYIRVLSGFIRMIYDSPNGLELASQLKLIEEQFSLNQKSAAEVAKHVPPIRTREEAYGVITALLIEGYAGSGKHCTPNDVALLMLHHTNGLDVDVYAPSGLGLFWASSRLRESSTKLVGSSGELSHRSLDLPEGLRDAYNPSAIGTNARVTFERLLIDLECWISEPVRTIDSRRVLLVNAAENPRPFPPLEGNDTPAPYEDSLNFLLSSNYSRVIALVPNIYLTGGAFFKATEVLKHLIQNGLHKVIQLPLGVIGAKHESYSILVFDSTAQTTGIQFQVVRETEATSIAARGFGQVNRRYTFKDSFLSSPNTPTFVESRTLSRDELDRTYLYATSTTRKKGRLPSVEASHFIGFESTPLLESIAEWTTLERVAEIHRVQYVPECGQDDGSPFKEITTETVGEFGEIDGIRGKFHRPEDSQRILSERLQADDILLCIRGPIGKLALVQESVLSEADDLPLLPNQSFVRIRPLRSPKEDLEAIQGDLLYWWLRSSACQRYLHAKTVSSGVGRLAILDIRRIPCPIVTPEISQAWNAQLANWKRGLDELSSLRLRLRALLNEGLG